MTDRDGPGDQSETPEDVATLYSWANLHGAKYRDFSASRAQTRENARQRLQDAIDAGRRSAAQDAEAARAATSQGAADEMPAAESPREPEFFSSSAPRQPELAAPQSAPQSAPQAEQLAAQQPVWQQPAGERFSSSPAATPAPPAVPYQPPQPQPLDQPRHAPTQGYRPPPGRAQYAPVREESSVQPRFPWSPSDPRETVARPAWLTQEFPESSGQIQAPAPPAQTPSPKAPEDTLQGSRDRVTSRWFALKSVFGGFHPTVETVPAQAPSRGAPVMAVFSLAGGVGKTSLVATLGRALSARGERVLLVDTAAFGLLPYFFGARDQRPGTLRTFSPPEGSGDASIQMVEIDPDALGSETAGLEPLTAEIARFSRGVSRIIVDLGSASGTTVRRVMRMAPLVLVPVIPDMNSVVSVNSIDTFFQRNLGAAGVPALPYYVLNQFDASLPLHLDIREVLREQLSDRLLPFSLRRAPVMSEALAEGMTVMDYAPNSNLAEDFASLAGWVKSLSAPASMSFRGVRWSER